MHIHLESQPFILSAKGLDNSHPKLLIVGGTHSLPPSLHLNPLFLENADEPVEAAVLPASPERLGSLACLDLATRVGVELPLSRGVDGELDAMWLRSLREATYLGCLCDGRRVLLLTPNRVFVYDLTQLAWQTGFGYAGPWAGAILEQRLVGNSPGTAGPAAAAGSAPLSVPFWEHALFLKGMVFNCNGGQFA
jgi:hypothetical protein